MISRGTQDIFTPVDLCVCFSAKVDSISTSSSQKNKDQEDDEEEDDEEEEEEEDNDVYSDNAIVVNDQPHLPHFGQVSVVNSNDVHFGNKTVYKGPVTIKQFVYPNSDINIEPVNSLTGLVKNVELVPNGGIINGGFMKDPKEQDSRVVSAEKASVEREQETNSITRIRKGFKWIRKRPKVTILVFTILLVLGVAFLIWRISPKGDLKNHVDEDDIVPINYNSDSNELVGKLRINNRLIWLAQPATGSLNVLRLPVSLAIIQHTATESCFSQARCVFQTRHIQTFHIESNGWSDIGYNFLVGGDGAVYEGRGWKSEGAHTLGWNNVSIGIAFIGTFNTEVPPPNMISAFDKLMEKGVELGYLKKDYKVAGARQFSGTESPGKAFYEVIKTWSHWSNSIKL